jgi:hypothetical protein
MYLEKNDYLEINSVFEKRRYVGGGNRSTGGREIE